MKRLQQTGRLSQPGRLRASPANIYATAMIKKACAETDKLGTSGTCSAHFLLAIAPPLGLEPWSASSRVPSRQLRVIEYTVSVQNRVRPVRPPRVKNEGSVDTRCQRGPRALRDCSLSFSGSPRTHNERAQKTHTGHGELRRTFSHIPEDP